MTMIDEATIVEAGRRISEAAPGSKVILFGSHARKTHIDSKGLRVPVAKLLLQKAREDLSAAQVLTATENQADTG